MGDALYQILLAGDSVITWVAVALAGLLAKWVLGKIGSDTVKKYVGRALDEVNDAVAEVYQTYVAALKKANEDGKLTDAEKAEAKRMAIDIAKSNIGSKGLARLARILGLGDVEDWLDTKVEATIAKAKATAPKP